MYRFILVLFIVGSLFAMPEKSMAVKLKCIAIQEIVSCQPGLSNCDSFLTCPQGTVATGGGFKVLNFSFGDIKIVASEPFSFGPDGEPIEWRVTAFTTTNAVVNQDFRATVICCGKKQ